MDLAAFLRARLDEDERIAREATPGPWTVEIHRHRVTGEIVDAEVLPVVEQEGNGAGGVRRPEDAEHIARHDPARVLAEVAAKRSILDDHTTPHTVVDGFCVEEGGECRHVGEAECPWHGDDNCPAVRALALPYVDHKDYQQEWKP